MLTAIAASVTIAVRIQNVVVP